jgi:CHASE2 domain-containing sensor protein
VTLAPWEYLFQPFNRRNFPDVFNLTWIAALGLLLVLIALYITRTRALHKHPPYVEMWEWLWWTGLITFSLILIGSLFVFDFFLILLTVVIGLGILVWIRFRRFPPYLAAYDKQLAKQKYNASRKYVDPDATIRKRGGRRQRRRR